MPAPQKPVVLTTPFRHSSQYSRGPTLSAKIMSILVPPWTQTKNSQQQSPASSVPASKTASSSSLHHEPQDFSQPNENKNDPPPKPSNELPQTAETSIIHTVSSPSSLHSDERPSSSKSKASSTMTPAPNFPFFQPSNPAISAQQYPWSRQGGKVSNYKWISGRRFHDIPGLSYHFPVDLEEIERLQMQHHLWKTLLQGNYLAPVKDSLSDGRVLDIGCGSGNWVLEMAAEFPTANIIGVDIVDTYFPEKSTRPPNCSFHWCNVLHGLPFPDATFDFIYIRMMGSGIKDIKWSDVLESVKRCVKPGGCVELLETDGDLLSTGPVTKKMIRRILSVQRARGVDPSIACRLKDLLNEVGFVNVQSNILQLPIGEWGGILGSRSKKDSILSLRNAGPIFAASMGISEQKYEEYLTVMETEFETHKTEVNVHVAFGQRALEDWQYVWQPEMGDGD